MHNDEIEVFINVRSGETWFTRNGISQTQGKSLIQNNALKKDEWHPSFRIYREGDSITFDNPIEGY